MARNSEKAPEVTQAEPTKARPLDGAGRPLDEHGLPVNGPARARALADRGIPDPALAEPAPEQAPQGTPPAGAQE